MSVADFVVRLAATVKTFRIIVGNGVIDCGSDRRVHRLDERESMKFRVSGVDLSDAVFAHEEGGMGVDQVVYQAET